MLTPAPASFERQYAWVEEPSSAYRRRDPTETLLYRVVRDHFLEFVRSREAEGRYLPEYVNREFVSFIECGVLANGFMRLTCGSCRHEKLVAFSCKRRGFCASCGTRRMSEQATFLSDWVFPSQAPVRQWVVSFPIQLRYWMARDSELLSKVLGVVLRCIAGLQRRRAEAQGFNRGESGAVTLVQRFGGSVNLNVHFHTLMMEGVYREDENRRAVFHELPPPSNEEVLEVLEQIQKRVVRLLVRRGYLADKSVESNEQEYLGIIEGDPTLTELCQGASVHNRIALGGNAGHRVRRLGSFGTQGELAFMEGTRCASLGGFSLHANTSVGAGEKDRLEKLCRYVARPPIATLRLSQAGNGDIIYRFKKEWSDGSQAVIFTPQEFMEKLVALIPQPRKHLTRFHGVLGPHHRLRSQIVPPPPPEESKDAMTGIKTPAEEPSVRKRDPRRLSWSELLKRVFRVDLSTCPDCGGGLGFIAAVMERTVVEKILDHLNLPTARPTFQQPRAPPQEAFRDGF
jgi:hypothetical protein